MPRRQLELPALRTSGLLTFAAERPRTRARRVTSVTCFSGPGAPLDLNQVRARGLRDAAAEALAHLTRPHGPEGFWVHLDADVLDDAIMPAVDYRMAGGMNFDELSDLLTTVVASERFVGIEVTIFNPALDPSGAIGRALTDALVTGLAPSQRPSGDHP